MAGYSSCNGCSPYYGGQPQRTIMPPLGPVPQTMQGIRPTDATNKINPALLTLMHVPYLMRGNPQYTSPLPDAPQFHTSHTPGTNYALAPVAYLDTLLQGDYMSVQGNMPTPNGVIREVQRDTKDGPESGKGLEEKVKKILGPAEAAKTRKMNQVIDELQAYYNGDYAPLRNQLYQFFGKRISPAKRLAVMQGLPEGARAYAGPILEERMKGRVSGGPYQVIGLPAEYPHQDFASKLSEREQLRYLIDHEEVHRLHEHKGYGSKKESASHELAVERTLLDYYAHSAVHAKNLIERAQYERLADVASHRVSYYTALYGKLHGGKVIIFDPQGLYKRAMEKHGQRKPQRNARSSKLSGARKTSQKKIN